MDRKLVAVMRRRLERRLARSRVANVPPPFVPPSDVAYRAELLDVASRAQEYIWSAIVPFLRARFDADEDAKDQLRRLFQKVRFAIPEKTAGSEAIATRMARDVEKANRVAMNAQFSRVVGIDIFGENVQGVAPRLRKAVRNNVELIESIPQELLTDVEGVVMPAVESGLRVAEIEKQIKERFSVSNSRAQLIARDQVGKLNGELNQARQEAVGVESYTWWTTGDERVRGRPGGVNPKGMHWELHGRVFRWDDPPITNSDGDHNHPGSDFQCRCQARPNVDQLLDALGI
jgi:SPP1 gp7 family putative phage head morphogenesis protein